MKSMVEGKVCSREFDLGARSLGEMVLEVRAEDPFVEFFRFFTIS